MAVYEIGPDKIGLANARGERRVIPSLEVSVDEPYGVRITQGPFGSYETVEMTHDQARWIADVSIRRPLPWWAREVPERKVPKRRRSR